MPAIIPSTGKNQPDVLFTLRSRYGYQGALMDETSSAAAALCSENNITLNGSTGCHSELAEVSLVIVRHGLPSARWKDCRRPQAPGFRPLVFAMTEVV
jgi:hypothetical protein